MDGIKAGVVVKTEFCRPGSRKFQKYIDYIDRKEAVRTKYSCEYNLYADYMGNPEKTSGLFTSQKDIISSGEKAQLKEIMQTAQENGSLMWQTVISFDNRWLQENGLYDQEMKILDERKLKEVTRNAVGKMLKNEGLEDALWSAAIHYNTDNIHVHIATVEPVPMRKKKEYIQYREVEQDGKTVKEPVLDAAGNPVKREEYIGRFQQKNIDQCKSTVVNQIMQQQQENLKINQIIRKSIIEQKKQHPLSADRELSAEFLRVYRNLPDCDRKMWNYNTNIMRGVRGQIDSLSRKYIETYHKKEYEELQESLKIQSLKYQQAYGLANDPEGYMKGKLEDLYTRLGNSILKEMRDYDKNMRAEFGYRREPEEEMAGADIADEAMEDAKAEERSGRMIEELSEEKTSSDEEWENHIKGSAGSGNSGNKHRQYKESRKPGISWSTTYREARNLIYRQPKDYKRALELLEQEPENALALYEIGNLYQYGRGVEIDKGKADEYYRQALQLFENVYEGLTGAGEDKFFRSYVPYRIAKHYFYGQGTEKDYQTAFQYYKKSAKEENPYALYSLGNMYYSGLGVEADYEKALAYYLEAAQEGNAYADEKAGKMYEEGLGCEADTQMEERFYRDAYEGFISMLRKDGDDNLEYKIAMMELRGKGTEINRESAVRHLENAAEAKNPYAMYQLAKIKMEKGDTESIREAEALLRKVAVKGNHDIAQYALGKLYTDPDSQIYHFEEGMKFLEMSLKNGNKQAGYQIGKLYADSRSEHYDLEKAIHYLEDPQLKENIYAQCLLGKCLLKLPQEIQRQRGIRILETAAEGGSIPAAYALGKYLACDSKNLGDVGRGVEMLKTIAGQGHEYAQLTLGTFYLKGERCSRDIEAAKYWLGQAKENGNQIAEEILENIEQREMEGRKFHGRNHRAAFYLGSAIRSLKRSMDQEWKKQMQKEKRRNEQEHEKLSAGRIDTDRSESQDRE